MQQIDGKAPTHPRVLIAVAVGGAIGASTRWSVAWLVEQIADERPQAAWPWATLVVNLSGAALIGIAAMRVARTGLAWAFLVTGVLGGFTTFSALAVEIDLLADADRVPVAIAYAVVTLAGGAAAVALGALATSGAPTGDPPSGADGAGVDA